MTRDRFLVELKRQLSEIGIDRNEITDILSEYEEHIEMGLRSGKTVSQIIDGLGSPDEIANEYSETNQIHKNRSLKPKDVFRDLFNSSLAKHFSLSKKITKYLYGFILAVCYLIDLAILVIGLLSLYIGIMEGFTGSVPGFDRLYPTTGSGWFFIFLAVSVLSGGTIIGLGLWLLTAKIAGLNAE